MFSPSILVNSKFCWKPPLFLFFWSPNLNSELKKEGNTKILGLPSEWGPNTSMRQYGSHTIYLTLVTSQLPNLFVIGQPLIQGHVCVHAAKNHFNNPHFFSSENQQNKCALKGMAYLCNVFLGERNGKCSDFYWT